MGTAGARDPHLQRDQAILRDTESQHTVGVGDQIELAGRPQELGLGARERLAVRAVQHHGMRQRCHVQRPLELSQHRLVLDRLNTQQAQEVYLATRGIGRRSQDALSQKEDARQNNGKTISHATMPSLYGSATGI